jgi:hypothetical protein
VLEGAVQDDLVVLPAHAQVDVPAGFPQVLDLLEVAARELEVLALQELAPVVTEIGRRANADRQGPRIDGRALVPQQVVTDEGGQQRAAIRLEAALVCG